MSSHPRVPGAASAALFGFALCVLPAAVRAACEPAGTDGPDTILCSGTETRGVQARGGADRVTVPRGAIVAVQVPGAATIPVAIDAGSGNDVVLNEGSVTSQLVAGGSAAAIGGVCPTWDANAAMARGIAGGAGADTIDNTGSISVSSLFQATRAATAASGPFCTLPLGAWATGIDGGDSGDRIANAGNLDVSATLEPAADNIGTDGMSRSGSTHAPAAPGALAVGLAGGHGTDDITNDGTLTVTAGSGVEGGAAHATGVTGGTSGSSIVNRGTLTVGATATDAGPAIALGIAGGAGRDAIENHGTIDVTADASRDSLTLALTLIGGDEVTATTALESRAVGLAAGPGRDSVLNTGTVTAGATSSIRTINVEHNIADTSHSDTTTTLRATAIGIDAGAGADGIDIDNRGTIAAQATSRSTSVNVEVNRVDAATADASLTLDATATGIAGGRGRDTITNSGVIRATATAEMVEVGVNASFVDVTIADRQGSNISTTLNATATGIDAAQGRDDLTITHGGSIEARANADATSVGVSLASEGVPLATEILFDTGALASIGITANSDARGIAAGSGRDRVASGGDITALATSDATQASINVGVAVFDFKLPTPGLVLGSAGTAANATATGIDTGDGNDEITSGGRVVAGADASASATTVSVNIAELSVDFLPGVPGFPLGASLVVADTKTEAHATATGIAAGNGDDRVTNTGSVETTAHADSGATSVSATLNIKFKEGENFLALNGVAARSDTFAEANATGIDGGAGRDELRNEGTVTAGATAAAHAVTVGVDVAGTVQGKGGAVSVALTDTSSEARAGATGLAGGAGDDSIVNAAGTIAATATADVDSVSVSSTMGIAKQGLVAGAALARAETIATATAVGIDGGEGADEIGNRAAISAKADADADSVAVSATIEGTAKGIEGGAALVDAGATATATAVGIRTGTETSRAGHDPHGPHGKDGTDASGSRAGAASGAASGEASGEASGDMVTHAGGVTAASGDGCHDCKPDASVINTGSITVDADANTDSVSVAAKIGIAKEGVALGAALADTSATSTATAIGIEADARDDTIVNAGTIGLRSVADADAVSVSLTVEGSATGLAAGAALVDASVDATARATGIAAGDGDDRIANTGSIVTQEIGSTATAVGVAASVLVAKEGAALGAALARTSATATTTASGMDGGAGDDELYNAGAITLQNVKADADAVTVSLEVALAKEGLAVGAALADSASTAQVTARGLDGGTGNDLLVNEGGVTLQHVTADANAVSVGVTLAGAQDGVAIGASLVDAEATATTTAAGLAGGDGRDTLANFGSITLDDIRAIADATGVSIGFTFAKEGLSIAAALAETGATATSRATGMEGGRGDDDLHNEGQVALSNVRAQADAVSVSVALAGANDGVAIAAGLADASGTAETVARAMDGGEGDDLIVNRGRLAATGIAAQADASSISVGLSGANAGVAAGVTIAVTSATARAEAKGVDGGSGDDELWNKDEIVLGQVTADADAVSVGVTINAAMSGVAAGAALGRAESTAEARATAVDGGAGDDWLANKGTITVDGVQTDTDATGVSAQLGVTNAGVAIGAALVDTSATARTFASGLEGGTGNDELVNTGDITLRNVGADANAVSVGVTLNAAISGGVAAGVALTDASGTAEVRATGLGGGEGDDTLINTGTVRAENVHADAHATGVSVTLNASMAGVAAGAALANTSATARADVTGLDGGAGDDVLYNTGAVDVQGRASADAVSVAVQVSGAIGAAGGAALTDASTTATATVTGIDGGAGRDQILNEGSVRAISEASATSTAVSVDISVGIGAGVALGDARATATASAVGIHDVGGGDEPCKPKPHGTRGASASAAWQVEPGAAEHGGDRPDDGCRDDRHGRDDDVNVIANRGEVTAGATARSHGTTVAVSLLGLALGETTNTSTATAAGIRLEDSRDVIRNEGTITATASATTDGLAVAVALGGAALGDASSTATASATGIDAGAKDDEIDNLAALAVDARSDASARSVSVGLIGVSEADASITSTATATGIDAGDGDDRVHNASAITVSAGLPAQRDGSGQCSAAAGGACATGSTVSVTLAGSGSSDATATSNATATGIDGGSGDDDLDNDGTLVITSLARARASGTSVTLLGASDVDASGTANASAEGLTGGDGRDHIRNSGSIDVQTAAETYARGVAFTLAGSASSAGNTLTTAQATGIGGGADDDAIANLDTGTMTVRATTASTVSASAWNFAGGAAADATLGAFTSASGIVGGLGADRIFNAGAIDVATNSFLSVTGTDSTSIFGGARAGSRVTADSIATGIDGGEQDDAIRNTGQIDAQASASLTSRATSFSFVGGATTTEVLVAASTATGIAGGTGDNALFNEGRITAAATAQLTATGGASSTLSDAEVAATVAARTTATGMSAGGGDDLLVNDDTGSIVVSVTAAPKADNDAAGGAFFADGVTRAVASATSHATGLDAGDGDNHVINKGAVSVTLGGTTEARGESDADILSSILGIDSDAYAVATAVLGPVDPKATPGTPAAVAVGILGGAGRDRVANLGTLDVSATPTVYAFARANGEAILSGDGSANATARANDVEAVGIRVGDGDNIVYNGGTITVTARPAANGDSASDADGIGEFREPDSRATTVVSADRTRAIGIHAGAGENTIVNEGTVTVSAAPQADKAEADADYGGDVLGIDAFATALAGADDARAFGVLAEGPDNFVWNKAEGTISVTAAPRAVADAFANGVGFDGDASPIAQASADGALAVGIRAAGADSRVVNDGAIRASTDAVADARAIASPSGNIINSGEVEDYAETASARSAQAVGIWTTGTSGVIENNGSVVVDAQATAAIANTLVGQARTDALAVGLRAGDGANRIDNAGDVRVSADATSDAVVRIPILDIYLGVSEATARAIGIEGGDGGNHVLNTGLILAEAFATGTTAASAQAIGIRTGSGDDTIVNRGTITATQTVNGVTTPGVAIDAGAGNDEVILGDGSVTNGTIDLGSGTNTLTLEGTPVINGAFMDGASSLTLQFLNDGSYNGALPGVAAIKDGLGTFTLSMLNPMQRIEVRQGTLHLTRDYAFVPEGSFAATVYGDGTHGQFRIGGLAQLAGSMSVVRGGGAYRDGTTYDVLLADGGLAPASTFDRLELPDATRLLAFSAQQLADRIRIEADVKSFTTVALTSNQMAMARNFDRMLPAVTGDLNAALGTIQTLNHDAEFATAFASLSPAAHEHHSRASLAGVRQYGQTLQDRLAALQVAQVPASAGQPVRVAFDAGRAALAQLGAPEDRAGRAFGVWMKGFAQKGKQDAHDTVNGYDHSLAGIALGIDRRFGSSVVAGASLGRASNNVDADADRSDADVTSRMFALYGSYFGERLYANGTLSAGRNEYDTRRTIVVGPTATPVTSRHRGDLLAASLGAGRLMRAGGSWFDGFANIQYTRLDEDGFREDGSGAGLVVAPRKTSALVSTLGVRWLQVFGAAGDATWTPEASLAWLHDFDRGGHLINAAYVDAPDATFSIAGQPVEKNGVQVGLGVTYRSSRGFATFLRYRGELRDRYAAHGVIGELRYEF